MEDLSRLCVIEWPYLFVIAGSGEYMIDMKTEIDGRVRAFTQGFFQTYMYLPSGMFGEGFAVNCGQPGAGGFADLGKAYAFSITARETGGGSAAASTTVLCPATRQIFSDGFESHDTSAWSGHSP